MGLVEWFVSSPLARRLPLYAHYYFYFVPGIRLVAGVTLFRRSKLALVLYGSYFLVLLADPVITYPVFTGSPYASTSLFTIYRNALSIPATLFWALAGGCTAYAWWLNKRGVLS